MKKFLILALIVLGVVAVASCSFKNSMVPKSCVLECDDSIPPRCECV